MIVALFLALGFAAGYLCTWREVSRANRDLAGAQDRIERLMRTLLAKEAGTVASLYLEDARPDPNATDGFWSEDGLVFIEDDEE